VTADPRREEMNLKRETKTASQSILVVDDDVQVCDLLADALTYMGHKVVTAGDGNEALEKLQDDSFGIIITDIDMPKMDGMELIKYVAKHREGVDIIAITGHVMKYRYTDMVAAGASDFITKPFGLNELEAKLSRIIRERCLREELERQAIEDPLTGLYNRRFFEQIVRKEATRSVRYHHSLYLLFLDIDHFKDYNDQKGHRAGDNLLIEFAKILKSSLRSDVDTASRFGGDEFTVLLPYISKEQAVQVGDRILEKYNSFGFKPTSLSVGIADFMYASGEIEQEVEDMIRRADEALYHAKHHLCGNTVYVYEESPG
jgi:two-component system cell cycle response regulator